ncbi:g protein alpha i subunit [Anaeramoeba ignava]|uniref:G protein alpha i subunit n=1 Tax=Anaeramoeba ignava TaxID=1746090 RepID=A0A9Q0LAG4_ANAIG|nr:g protein alpha i subunit [Anaeramoeba ignava]
MGFGKSKLKKKQAKSRNEEIEKQIIKDQEEMEKRIKILILGAGECGKSTFVKQLMILHTGGFTESIRGLYRQAIRTQVIENMKTLIIATRQLRLKISDDKQVCSEQIEKCFPDGLDPEIGECIAELWEDKSIKITFENRSLFQIPDQASYFFDNVKRVSSDDFVPNDEDIINCRIPTTGVSKINFEIEGRPWEVVDVGGQRSERRKWIHQFDNVTIVIFVVASNEYDQRLTEEVQVNRMHEAVSLFNKTVNNSYFREKNILILFNKCDLFEEKIQKVDLNVCFPEYNGGLNYENGINFLKKKFVDLGTNSKRSIFSHVTCAIQTEKIKAVVDVVNSTILENTLKKKGYL